MNWNPFTIEEVSSRLSTNENWFFVGGISIDLYLGYKSREHGDIDIGVFHPNVKPILELLQASGLSLFRAAAGELTPLTDNHITDGAHNFWAADASGYRLQILTYPLSPSGVVFRRNPSVTFPAESFVINAGGYRILNPIVSILFKATTHTPEPKDLQDIANIMKTVSAAPVGD